MAQSQVHRIIHGRIPAWLIRLLLIIFVSGLSAIAIAQTRSNIKVASRADFSGLETANLKFLSTKLCEKDYVRSSLEKRALARRMARSEALARENPGEGLFNWTPNALPERQESIGCDPRTVESWLIESRGSTRHQASSVREFFNRCGSELKRSAPNGILALFNLATTEYEMCEHPNIRKLVISLPNGDLLRGYLALKPGSAPRPLVIVKCGTLCNAGEHSHRFMMMHLFDESPFNVLLVASSTGADFIRDNDYVTIGGFSEAQQIFQLAKMLKEGPIAKRISTLHLIGISLGAHSALFASYMNPFNSAGGKSSPLSSVLALCPVVDLKDSMRSLFDSSIKGTYARSSLDGEIIKVVSMFPSLRSLLPDRTIETESLPDFFARSATSYHRKLKAGWAFPPFEQIQIRNIDELWERNNFLKIAERPITTPTMVLAGDDDLIVPTATNSRALAKVISKSERSSRTFAEKNRLQVVTIPSGNHCAFNEVYGWRTASAIYRGFVLSHAPELRRHRKTKTVQVSKSVYEDEDQLDLWPDEAHHLISYAFEPGEASMTVTYKIFSGAYRGCNSSASIAENSCFREVDLEIPFSSLSERPWWAHAPRSQAEADSRTRWANTSLRMLGADGLSINNRREKGLQLRWVGYQE